MGYGNVELPIGTRFLVTGSAGFIGSNLVEALLDLGHKVYSLDNYSTGKRQNVEEFLSNQLYEFIEGDIRDFNVCRQACQHIDYVLHQAALGSVPRSMIHPLIYEDNNVKGTSNILEAARLAGVKRVIYASSSSVYGDSLTLPKMEGAEGNILSPYALSKKVNEQYGALYTQVYGLECIGLRYFNVFGRWQDPNGAYAAVIPKFLKQLLNNENPTINGDGRQSRDFTYIDNVIEANIKACLAPSEAAGQVFNIAYGSREYLIDIYYDLCRALARQIEPNFGPERAGDIKHSNADISKAKQFLGYEPDYDFAKGIVLAMEWYKNNLL